MSVPAASLPKTAVNGGPGVGLKRVLGPDYRMAYLFVTPIALFVLSLVAYPFCYAVYLSMTHKLVGLPPVFVGFENYAHLLNDRTFRRSLWNTSVYTAIVAPVSIVLGLGVALLIEGEGRARGFFRTVYFLPVASLMLMSPIRWRSFWTGVLLIPWVAPTVVSALNFLWIFDGSLGVLNYLLVRVFRILPQGVGWLSEPHTAMASVIAVNIWRGFPFFGISFLAGMKAIPLELYEAAAVDGAGTLQRFRHVTLPGLKNIMIIVVLLSTIWTFNDFQIVYILTKGGPGGTTMVMPVFTYETAFGAQRLGEAIAVALYLLPALAITIMVLARYMRKGRKR